MKHLVTGGSGFLGNLITRRLLAQGEDVRILDIWEDPLRPPETEFVLCDIRNRDGVLRAMQDVDIVHHTVALVPLTKSGQLFHDVNVNGSRIAAEAAAEAGVGAFIHMSSSAIFGAPTVCPVTESTPFKPLEIYGRGKLAGEQAVQAVCTQHKLPLIVIRPRTILGEGRLGIFEILFDWIRDQRRIYIIDSGSGGLQFVHAHDLMDFYMLALAHQRPGHYNVGAPEFGSLRQDLTELIHYAGSTSTVVSIPPVLAINSLRLLDWLNLSPLAPWHYLTYHKPFHFDVAPLLAMGWQPQYSNQRMLQESYDWFIAHPEAFGQSHGGSVHRSTVKQRMLGLLKRLS
jgi:nucleoside-diphosphate-sugar epimerase